jgi:flavodoxin
MGARRGYQSEAGKGFGVYAEEDSRAMVEEIAGDLESKRRIDVCYFSWRGTSKKVAEQIVRSLSNYQVRLIEIKPLRDYPYIIWLILSFIPGLDVKSTFDEPKSRVIFLCLPKWTFNCLPITYFLKKVDLSGKIIFLAITYGGFDEKRYAASLARKIERRGGKVRNVLLVKRRNLEKHPGDVLEIISNWAVECVSKIEM